MVKPAYRKRICVHSSLVLLHRPAVATVKARPATTRSRHQPPQCVPLFPFGQCATHGVGRPLLCRFQATTGTHWLCLDLGAQDSVAGVGLGIERF